MKAIQILLPNFLIFPFKLLRKYFKNLAFNFAAVIIFYFTLITVVLPQSSGSLRGVVTDSLTSESLTYANVFIKELEIGSSTDDHGYYFIPSIPANKKYTVTVSYIGYLSKSETVMIAPNKITNLDVDISPNSVKFQTIEKIGVRLIEKNAPDIGLKRISIKSIQALPKGVETDVFRSLQYMPGVNFAADVSAKYYVRGGDNNQNLVLLNGATIYNPFHALGLFSVIDPDMIKNIKFYKGSSPAEYGGRLSSVMDIKTIDGNRNRVSGQASLSLLTAKAMVEAPIPHGSVVVTGRRSYNTKILKDFLNDKTIPFDFYDASIKLNYSNPNFIPGSKFVLHYFTSNDKLNNKDLFKEDFFWTNDVFGFSWFKVYDIPLFSELNVSVSKFKGKVSPNLSTARAIQNDVQDITFNYKFNYIYSSKDEMSMGLQIHSIETNLFLENNTGVFSNNNIKGVNIVMFAKYKLLRSDKFGLDFGVRYNLTGLTNKGANYFEPRISFTYTPFASISIKGAWGKYQQEITTISDENEVVSVFSPYTIVPRYLSTPRSTHYSLGLEIYFTDFWKVNTEIYYKNLYNITAINPDNNYFGTRSLVSADGESYGLEMSSVLSLSPFKLIASYTFSYAYKEVDNWLYYPKYDSRHFLNLILETNIGKGWKASLVWSYKTGLPFTPTTGFYQKLLMSDLRRDWDIYSNYIPYAILGDKNIARLTQYHRLDFSLSKKFQIGFIQYEIGADIINVYNRNNIFYFDRSTGKQVNMLPFLPTFSIKVKL